MQCVNGTPCNGTILLLFLIKMPDYWLEVSNRQVLRPVIPTQVFLGFPVPKS